jgi:SAM-dependent methyltransferase
MFRKHGWKALYKQFRPHDYRPWSRAIVREHLPQSGVGLEVGVGEWTISPVDRTVLSDGFKSHADNRSIAQVIFPADQIPVEAGTFAFLLSEHVLEHVPNVYRTLKEWNRVLKKDGVLILFLPHPLRTFDHYRKETTLEHLREEERLGSDKFEDGHWEDWKTEVLDRELAPQYWNLPKEEALKTGSLHRHVFGPDRMKEILGENGFKPVFAQGDVPDRPDSYVVIARKIS